MDAPLIKGRITLFFLPSRYEYSEFGKMVEQRQLPADWRGHWKYNVVDAYGVIMPPAAGADYSQAGIVAQQVAAIYMASLRGEPPFWFSDGFGRAFWRG